MPSKNCDVSSFLRDLIQTKKHFLEEHRYDPFEIYSDEFEDELKAIPDPKIEPIKCLDQFLDVLDEFGPYCADRAALNLIAQIEKSKIKTPYERHYLLLCLVSTTFIQIRAYCEHIFLQIPNEKECIETYSSPKALRLLDILRRFKSEKSIDESAIKRIEPIVENNSNGISENNVIIKEKNPPRDQNDTNITIEKTDEDTKIKINLNTNKKIKNNFPRAQRSHNHNHQNDANALCGIIFCNSIFTAKILFAFIYEMSKHDTDLDYLSVQYTGDKVADPITESKQFENEHRKQEEVLKRFRMHSCNLLIGTSVLEEGIELPKCNLVIRWDLPTTYRSYVQCKGRARAQKAYHIIMVAAQNSSNDVQSDKEFLSQENHRKICSTSEGDETMIHCYETDEIETFFEKEQQRNENEHSSDLMVNHIDLGLNAMENKTENIVKLLAQYMQIERILLRKCSNHEPTMQELIEADSFTNFIKPYIPISGNDSNTCFVSLATAVVLVNKYCAKLPSDTFTKLTPLWRCIKTYRGNKQYYQYTVRLPINSPVKQDIYVSIH